MKITNLLTIAIFVSCSYLILNQFGCTPGNCGCDEKKEVTTKAEIDAIPNTVDTVVDNVPEINDTLIVSKKLKHLKMKIVIPYRYQ